MKEQEMERAKIYKFDEATVNVGPRVFSVTTFFSSGMWRALVTLRLGDDEPGLDGFTVVGATEEHALALAASIYRKLYGAD